MNPTEIKRLRDAAALGLKDSVWCTTLGRLHLTGKIDSTQFAAGNKWAALMVDYAQACQCPKQPATVSFDRAGATRVDPDSELGIKQAKHHEKITLAFLDGRAALRRAGYESERVVDSVCVQDLAPAGLLELEALRSGLHALSVLWLAKSKRVTG